MTHHQNRGKHLGQHKAHHGHAYGTHRGATQHKAPGVHGDEDTPSVALDADEAGATSENEPNYGAGDTGSSLPDPLEPGGGIDPFGLAVFDQPGPDWDAIDLAPFESDPLVKDHYSPRTQIPTLRNPVVGFGFDEFYSGFGPAALIGCDADGEIVIGCDGALKK